MNIVICCDGTGDEFSRHQTNVMRLYMMLARDPTLQRTYYQPGVGTLPVSNRRTTFNALAFAAGIQTDIAAMYAFLMKYYCEDANVYLFGFSRGAFAVRALASLLRVYGLLLPDHEHLIPYLIRNIGTTHEHRIDKDIRTRRIEDTDTIREQYFHRLRTSMAMIEVISRPIPVWFVGVWDTVGSVGWLWDWTVPFMGFNPVIKVARHAIAIDERRAMFRQMMFLSEQRSSSPPQDLKQVWFPGVHADVGGGYAEAESGLAKVALRWMVEEATAAGLLVDSNIQHKLIGLGDHSFAAPDPNGRLHESLTRGWHVAEFFPKRTYDWETFRLIHRMNLYRRRAIPPGSLIHAAAFERGEGYAVRLPPDAVRVQ